MVEHTTDTRGTVVRFHVLVLARNVAQWESSSFVTSRLGLRLLSLAPSLSPSGMAPTLGVGMMQVRFLLD